MTSLFNVNCCVAFVLHLTLIPYTDGWSQQRDLYRCPSTLRRNKYLQTFGGKCYEFIVKERYHDEAEMDCNGRGGTLVQILDSLTQSFVMYTLKKLRWPWNAVWIGATDAEQEGRWTWLNGGNLRYSNWAKGQPSCKIFCVEDCAILRYDEGGLWHDKTCRSSFYHYSYICQYDMLSATQKTTSTTSGPLRTSVAITTPMYLNPPTTTTVHISEQTTTTKRVNKSQATVKTTEALFNLPNTYSNGRMTDVSTTSFTDVKLVLPTTFTKTKLEGEIVTHIPANHHYMNTQKVKARVNISRTNIHHENSSRDSNNTTRDALTKTTALTPNNITFDPKRNASMFKLINHSAKNLDMSSLSSHNTLNSKVIASERKEVDSSFKGVDLVKNEDHNVFKGALIGSLFGAFIVILCCIMGIYLIRRKRQERRNKDDQSSTLNFQNPSYGHIRLKFLDECEPLYNEIDDPFGR